MTQQDYPVYGEITGPIVMIGFGSIGRGTLPLIERHFKFDKSRMVVIDPRDDAADMEILAQHGIRHIKAHVTKDNYKDMLAPLLSDGEGQGFCVNLSVDTGSVDLIKLCRKLDVLYIDTVIEPWLGFYFDKGMKNSERTNYALRETLRHEKKKHPGGTTAVSTCGANPGMVSWFVKQALVNLANDLGIKFKEPDQHDREGWAKLMKKVGVKGVHIAERDTQLSKMPKPLNVFWNTWSVEGFISEGLQPAELGWIAPRAEDQAVRRLVAIGHLDYPVNGPNDQFNHPKETDHTEQQQVDEQVDQDDLLVLFDHLVNRVQFEHQQSGSAGTVLPHHRLGNNQMLSYSTEHDPPE